MVDPLNTPTAFLWRLKSHEPSKPAKSFADFLKAVFSKLKPWLNPKARLGEGSHGGCDIDKAPSAGTDFLFCL